MSNKAFRKLAWGLICTLVLLSSLLWACIPTTEAEDEPPITFAIGNPVEVASETIGTDGGTISIDKPGDPIDGLTIDIPEGAYGSPTTFTISYQPILDVKAKDDARIFSPLISIDNGGDYSNELIEVRVPATIPEDYFAMAFFYDPENGYFEGLHTLNLDDNTVMFVTRHFSKVNLLGFPKYRLEKLKVDTNFKPGRDTWNLANRGSYVSPGGYCSGMTLTALDHYEVRKRWEGDLWKDDNDNGLGAEMKTPDFWRDDKWAIQLCSVANSSRITKYGLHCIANYTKMAELLMPNSKITFDAQEFYNIALSLWYNKCPQLISVRCTSEDYVGHSLICYGINNNVLSIADPNYPSNTEIKLVYDTSNGRFEPYSSAQGLPDLESGRGIKFDVVVYSGYSYLYDWDKLRSLWEQFEREDFGEYFPKYGILVTEYDAKGNEGASFELHPTQGLSTNAKYLQFRIYAPFDSRAYIYRFQDLGNSLSPDRVELNLGDNLLGIYVEGENEGLWWWAGFDWVNITCNPEEEPQQPVAEIDPCSKEAFDEMCKRGVGFITSQECGTCWKCVDGEAVQIECSSP